MQTTLTIPQIEAALAAHQKPLSRRQVYRYLAQLNLEPIGARQRPQRYPAHTARTILTHLGITPSTRRAA
jgi:hypothetical protein